MFWAERRAEAAITIAPSSSPGWSSAHCSDLHPAERAADRRAEAADPEMADERPVDGDEVGDGEEGEAQAVGSAGGGVGRLADPSSPGSRRGCSSRRRRGGPCRAGAPGRSALSHQPRRRGSPWWPAAWASPVSAWQTYTAFERPGVQRAVGLVRDLDGREPSTPESRRSGSSRSNRTTRCVCDRVRGAGAQACDRRSRAPASAWSRSADEVVDVLDPDRQAHEVLGHAGRPPARPSFSCEWVVEAWMDRERLRVADVGEVARRAAAPSMKRRPASRPPRDAEGHERARSRRSGRGRRPRGRGELSRPG